MTAHVLDREDRRVVVDAVGIRLVVAGAVYGGFAAAYETVSPHPGRPPLVDVVVATVVVAVLLWAGHDRLDRLVRRGVLGERADSHDAMRELLHRMATTLPVDEVVPRVAEAASRTTGRERAEVRLWLAEGEQWSQAWPAAAEPGPVGTRLTVGVRHAGAAVGEIAVDLGDERLSPVARRLLDDLAGPAGLALSTVRLTVELRRRKAELERLGAELEASRDRLLTARTVEQRRLRGEVTARVMTHVSAARAALELPPAGLGPGCDDARDAGAPATVEVSQVERAGVEAGRALDALRTIARGVFPPRLADDGYAASVDGWLVRSALAARLDLGDGVAALRGHPELESCLYFCTVTVLAALAAGGASDLQVGIGVDVADRAELRVSGSGGRPLGDDVRLVVADRVEALGGTVAAGAGAGRTGVVASLPIRGQAPSATERAPGEPAS